MNNGIQRFKQEAINIQSHFPDLQFMESEDGSPYISGNLILNDKQGVFLDNYTILIKPVSGYPFRFPHIFETGGRIPINIDWHVFEDGHCCIKAVPEEILLCKHGINLNWFIETQVKPYFFNQTYRELKGFFLHERSHGPKGNIEFFEDVFKTKNLLIIISGLRFIKKRTKPNRVSRCFCGSGLKYRNCHQETYRQFSEFTDRELDACIRMVYNWMAIVENEIK